ncbi:hypothetical protein FJTKL_04679 [Diaporthe vaccinii]|uniref:GPI inositol-deacylase winged helix domain-containing protein n=1 Tax=Diaporthe vaccinii TaxID=105482 RepID=A0ABR4EZN5_9PEZI
MFVWVTFQLDLFSRLTTDKAIRDGLRRLPRGLNKTYIQLLEEIRDKDTEHIGMITKALTWIVSSLVPLTLGQLAEAISIDSGDTHLAIDKMFNDEKDLLEMLGSLVIFDPAKKDPLVSLAHFTLYEFLQSDELRTHESLASFYVPARTMMDIGFTCAQYLSFADFAVITGSEGRLPDALRSGPDLEASGNRGQTALHLAASYGHVGMIKMLLEAGASPHARSESGSTPAYRAARNGSIAALELLAEAGSDLDAMTWDGWTAVFEAIENHHVLVVEWLVRKGVNLRQKILHGSSVLEFARGAGDQAIVEIVEKGL